MSININVHGNTINRLMLGDPERCRREELQRRKLLRLEQVRQQSKDIASQLRMRVSEERKRQIDRIDQIKEDEVRAWKEKHLGKMDDLLEECVGKVGEAHAAAKNEIELEKKRLEQQTANRRLAAKRGREALAKLEMDKQKQKKVPRKPIVAAKRPVSGKQGSHVHVATQVGDSINEIDGMCADPMNALITQNISSDTLSSSIEVAIKSLKPLIPSLYTHISSCSELDVPINCGTFQLPNNPAENTKPPTHDSQFTLATDLINRRRQTNPSVDNQSGFPLETISNNTAPRPPRQNTYVNRNASSVMNTENEFVFVPYEKDIYPTIPREQNSVTRNTSSTRPKPIAGKPGYSPSKRSSVPSKGKPNEMIANHPALVSTNTKPANSNPPSVPNGISQKPSVATDNLVVQSQSSLEAEYYEPDEHLIVHQEAADSYAPNSIESAGIDIQADDQRVAPQITNRPKPDHRGLIALERERMRKDYDLMSAKLDQLSKEFEYVQQNTEPTIDHAEEQLKQMAQDRQIAMNKLVKDAPIVAMPTQQPDALPEPYSDDRARADPPPAIRDQSDDSGSIIEVNVSGAKQLGSQVSQPDSSDALRPKAIDKENHAQLANERKQIEKRERDVKSKERKLEERLLKMFQETQQKDQHSTATSVRVQTDKCLEKDVRIRQTETLDSGVQIIIQVNGGNKYAGTSKATSHPPKPHKSIKVVPLRDTSSQVFPKTPLKALAAETIPAADGSSTSTTYQSLPKVIRTQLTDALKTNHIAPRNETNSSKHNSIASSTLRQYIKRLLGMSRASIDQLEVSDVSTVSTPGSSLINISTNVSHEHQQQPDPIDDQHINKLQSFIQDNHNFISDLEKSLREISMSSDEASNLKAVETAWMETLAKKEQEMQMLKKDKKRVVHAKHQAVVTATAPIKPILKKPASPKKVQVVESQSRIKLDKSRQVGHGERVESSTQKCNQRIADLNEMICKVRREKQRLLESTYSSMGSSVSDAYQNSTEYLEVARKIQSEGSNNSSRTTTDLPSLSEERKLEVGEPSSLAASKQIGISRDSGLGGVSRPMTASDAPAYSPDSRPNATTTDEETEQAQGAGTNFQRITSTKQVDTLQASATKRRPPSSLQRFGPQIEQLDLGHDLSTIIEVDTPIATSRMNTTLNDARPNSPESNEAKLAQLLLEISSNTRNTLKISHFPYEPSMDHDTIQSLSNSRTQFQIQPFPSHASFADGVSGLIDTASIMADEDVEPSAKDLFDHAHIRPFVTHKEFAKETSGLCTSQSVAAALLDDDLGSFPDVETELRKRNLLQHSVESLFVVEPNDDNVQARNEDAKAKVKIPTYSTSSSDNLEQEMQKLGINWASSMMKKNKIATTQALTTSSSSSNDELLQSINTLNPKRNTSINIDFSPHVASPPNASNQSIGKPLNLKEFLARELLKRSNSLSSSSAHDDSTLASQFLRSLLGSSGDNSSQMSGGLVYTSERHRTSTPVRDVRPQTPGRPAPVIAVDEVETSRTKSATYHMFSGESGMSSVRGTTVSSSDKDGTTSRDASPSDGGHLKMPTTKLRSGTSSSAS